MFPPEINDIMWRVQSGCSEKLGMPRCLDELGIPLQVKKLTLEDLKSGTLDEGYISEVLKGETSHGFSQHFNNILLQNRDLEMFSKYTNDVYSIFPPLKIKNVVAKDKNGIIPYEQEILAKFWNKFKKMKMIIALFIRLKEGKSMFSNPDLDILGYFQRTYFKEYPEILKLYNRILGGIENIDNWYGFLKEGKLKGGDLEWDLEETFEHLYAEFRIVKSFITKNLPQSTTSSPASQLLTN